MSSFLFISIYWNLNIQGDGIKRWGLWRYFKIKSRGWNPLEENNIFITASQAIKYLRINFTKELKDLYTENYKTLMKQIKKDIEKSKDIILKVIHRFNAILIKIPTEVKSRSSNLCEILRGPEAKIILKKE